MSGHVVRTGVVSADIDFKENIKEFECPICLELILGAAILPCGHLSCMYCCHCSMNLENSHCFICKKRYTALPGLSTQLSLLILSTFREQFDERIKRESESANEEFEKFLLPFAKYLKEELKMNASALTESVTCNKCKRILVNPIAASCGHIYCQSCVQRGNIKKCIANDCYGGDIDKEAGVVKALQHLLEKMYPLEIEERIKSLEDEGDSMMQTIPVGKEGKQEEEEEEEEEGEEEIHFGVGCDLCGSYPIKGERYQCLDCKEDANGCPLGFDLCGKCKEFDDKVGSNVTSANAFAAAGRFRFLQNHTREHRLVKIPFRESFLHRLKAANPQMSIEQILRIISIAGEEREEEEEEEEELGEPGEVNSDEEQEQGS